MPRHSILSAVTAREHGLLRVNLKEFISKCHHIDLPKGDSYGEKNEQSKNTEETAYTQQSKDLYDIETLQPIFTVITAAALQYYTPQQEYPTQQQSNHIEAMSREAFLNYLVSELSDDNVESLMVFEKYRLKTFSANWRHNSESLAGHKMAAAGFYFINEGDRVVCTFCRGSLHCWESGDSPSDEHRTGFPFCAFIQGQECGNIPLNSESQNDVVLLRNSELSTQQVFTTNQYGEVDTNITSKQQLQQELLFEKCRQLGYEQTAIDAAVRAHGCLFEGVAEITDAISRLANDQDQDDDDHRANFNFHPKIDLM